MGFAKKKYFCIAIAPVILIFSLLYILAISPYWKITPDSATYVLAGKSLAAGQGYQVRGKPVVLYPPITSFIFSVPLLLFPESYLALRAVITIFTLLSIYLCFLLLKAEAGDLTAGIVALLSIGSIYLFRQSTLLLSDVFYMFFSLMALWFLQNARNKEPGWLGNVLAALTILVACMTRIVGLTLPLAIIGYALTDRLRRKTQINYPLVALMVVVILPVLLWEYRNLQMGFSFFKLLAQNEPWIEEGGYVSLLGLVKRLFTNLSEYSEIGAILTNDMAASFFRQYRVAQLMFLSLLGLIFGTGLYISMTKNPSVSAIYSVLYIASVELYHPEVELRWFLPVLPFLFYYIVRGLECVLTKLGSVLGSLCRSATVVYALCYLGYGFIYMLTALSEEHRSPFGSFPIKYPYNYDEQRLALWMRDYGSARAVYVCQHPAIMDLITERKGYTFPFSSDPKLLLELLRDKKIRYVLVDKTKPTVQEFLLPVITQYPTAFDLVKEERKASLYEFKL